MNLYIIKRGVAMRIYENICDLRQRSSWIPVVFKITETGMVITRHHNGDWTEKYISNLYKTSNLLRNVRDLHTRAECDAMYIDEYISNYELEDIHLEVKPISYTPK